MNGVPHPLAQLQWDFEEGRRPLNSMLRALDSYQRRLEATWNQETAWRPVPELHAALVEGIGFLLSATDCLRDFVLDPDPSHRRLFLCLLARGEELVRAVADVSAEMLEVRQVGSFYAC